MRNSFGALSLLALARFTAGACIGDSPCQASVDAVPTCGTSCIFSAASAVGCQSADFKCQCDKFNDIAGAAAGCVAAACDGNPLPVVYGVQSLCACVTASPTTSCDTGATTTAEPATTTTAPATTSAPGTTDEPTQTTGPITTAPACTDADSPCAASASAVPSCGTSCIFSAASAVGCASTDFQCQCDKFNDIAGKAAGCVAAACDGNPLPVVNGVQSLCACVTASPTTPCSAGPTTTAEPGTTSEEPGTTTTEEPSTTTKGPVTSGPACTDADSPCAASASAVPSCGTSCIFSAASAVGCASTDFQCQCDKFNDIAGKAAGCVAAACDGNPLPVVNGVQSLCACVTASPTTPCSAGPTTTGAVTTSEGGGGTTTDEPVTTTGPITTAPACTNPASPCQKVADAVPACGTSCIFSAASAVGCGSTDYACQCGKFNDIAGKAAGCVAAACDGNPLPVVNGVQSLCSCVTASPTTPCTDGPTTTGGGGEVTTTDEPVTTTTQKPTQSCDAGTKVDCGPVATSAVPQCAQKCFNEGAPKVGCKVDDYACQCEADAQASLSQILIPCVATACPGASLPAVIAGASSVCACASAAPTGGSCPPGTGNPPGHVTTSKGGSGGSPTTTAGGGSDCVPGTTQNCGPVATSAVPQCAQKCFNEGAPKVGCKADDYACQCEADAQASLSQILIPCVATACPAASLPAVIAGASSVCACASAAPTGGSCPPGTGNPPGHVTTSKGGSGGSPTTTMGGGSDCVPGTTQNCGPVATSAVPQCAQKCFNDGAPKVGCKADDYACQCEADAQASLSQILIPCVATACPAASLPAVIAGASSVCACASAAPTGGSCPPSGGGNPPSGGGNPPSGGGNPPSGGGNPPSGGGDNGGSGSGGSGGNGGSGGGSGGSGGSGSGGQAGPGSACDIVTIADCSTVITTTTCYATGSVPTGSTGGSSGSGGSGGDSGENPPTVVPGSAARFEIGLVAGVFGAAWLAAVAL